MFYSQFILAKKGPLGTIWIAAHLERKLRKNQVADTDIGVSVDSILFPDVPIALRLSSHLLLGVVRIYSRKVNYLFDDCSEALLKIKQAFRSTAVDLPPEESTAPYHSITLPETFDLDDFELPDNEIFQTNYVDHHVSTREQITLQDTMEGVVYPTSQFGLDERFGDGDTSQIGLDLDEDMFLDKVAASGSDGVALGMETDVQASVRPTTPLKIDEINKGTAETSDTMFDDGSSNQMHGLAASIDLIECADAPATPGLMGEPSLATVQEPIGFDENMVYQNSEVLEVEERLANCSNTSDHHKENKSAVGCSTCNDMNLDVDMNLDDVRSISAEKNSSLLSRQEIKRGELQGGDNLSSDYPNDASILCSDISKQAKSNTVGSSYLERPEKSEGGIQSNGDTIVPITDQNHIDVAEPQGVNTGETTASYFIPSAVSIEPSSDNEINPGKSLPSSTIQRVSEGIELVNASSTEFFAVDLETPWSRDSEEQRNSKIVSCVVPEEMPSASMHETPCSQNSEEQRNSKIVSCVVPEEMPSASMHETPWPQISEEQRNSKIVGCVVPEGMPSASMHETPLSQNSEGQRNSKIVGCVFPEEMPSASMHETPWSQNSEEHRNSKIVSYVVPEEMPSASMHETPWSQNIEEQTNSKIGSCVVPEEMPSASMHETPWSQNSEEQTNSKIVSCVVPEEMPSASMHETPWSQNSEEQRNSKIVSCVVPEEMLSASMHETPWSQNSEEQRNSKSVSCVVPEEMPSTSMHLLQPCVLHGKDPNLLSEEGKFPGAVPAPPPSIVNVNGQCTLEAAGIELVNTYGALPELQGKGCDAVDVRMQVSEVTPILESTTSGNNQAGCSKLDEQLSSILSRDVSSENLGRTTNPEFAAPEKLLSVLEVPSDLRSNCFVDCTPEKEVQVEAESNGAGLKVVAGERHSLEGSMMSFQSLISDESFGLCGIKRTAASSVPDDDDLLSSILVGRKSSVLKMRPTPSPEVAPMKRLRTGPRISASKRKLLVDDSMILHGDTIRQQLMSTEDIRRMRRKAPCTRPEIWMIQKKILDDEIFSEPITTGMSMELNFLHGRAYDLAGIKVFPHNENSASVELRKAMDVPARPSVSVSGKWEEMLSSSIARNDKEAGSAETILWDKNQQYEEHFDNAQVHAKACVDPSELCNLQREVLHDHAKASMDPSQLSNSQSEVLHEQAGIEIVRASSAPSNAADHVTTLGVELSSAFHSEKEVCHITAESEVQPMALVDASVPMDASRTSPDRVFNEQASHDNASILNPNEGYAVAVGTEFASKPNHLLEGAEAGQSVEGISFIRDDCSVSVGYVNPSLVNLSEAAELNSKDAAKGDLTRVEDGKNELGFVSEDVVEGAEFDSYKNPRISRIHDEDPNLDASYSIELNAGIKNVFSNAAENPGCKENETQIMMGMENRDFDEPAVEVRDDFKESMIGHDTEFLNVDDEDVAEDKDRRMHASDEQILENSGWSSRTRAVAKYLQTLFNREGEKGKTVLPMDNLLAGKTRKEASRMFFETLVLKTRDYVHVEQSRPFDNISIKPRMKLMKSDF